MDHGKMIYNCSIQTFKTVTDGVLVCFSSILQTAHAH
jgi:hypothetical protein